MDITNIFVFVGAIALLIIVHEFGHLIASRLLKVEVEEFGLGFPPRALTLFKLGGTIYSLNWIPLGGFVRPKGENDPNVPGGLAAASPWVRIAVFAAGPLANFLTAILLFAFIFTQMGVPDTTQTEIFDVNKNSPAEWAGLEKGDFILEINGVVIDDPQILTAMIQQNAGKETLFVYQHDGQIRETTLTPRENPPPGEGAIGIFYTHPLIPITAAGSLGLGVGAVYDQAMEILTLPARIIEGSIAPEQTRLVGYKGMYDMYRAVREADAADDSLTGINTLYFFASISISLGLINLLPIPALDGGRILFALPEIILRRRIPQNYENAINLVSFAMLILLMLYINVQDFVNPADFR